MGSSGNRSTEHRGLHPGDGRTHLGHLLPQRSGQAFPFYIPQILDKSSYIFQDQIKTDYFCLMSSIEGNKIQAWCKAILYMHIIHLNIRIGVKLCARGIKLYFSFDIY